MFKQKFEAVGRLAADPELRYTPSGAQVANARVAINDGYMGTEGWVERTIWATLTFWGKIAEAIGEKGHKGDQILFVGSLVYDEKTGAPKMFDGKNGKGAKFEFRVNEYQLFPKDGGAATSAKSDDDDVPAGEGEDEIPF